MENSKIALSYCFLLFFSALNAQKVIQIRNPSFEKIDTSTVHLQATDWFISENSTYVPLDLQPNNCNITRKAHDGQSFISLKTSSKNAMDYIGQTLEKDVFLRKDSIYMIEVDLAFSKEFLDEKTSFFSNKNGNNPVSFYISGSNTETKMYEILAKSEPIEHADWQKHTFILQPQKDDYNQIQLEAYYEGNGKKSQFGSILIDNCTEITKLRPTQKISLKNPSFESDPRCCTPPKGWSNAGLPEETATDIQPGYFSVNIKAYNGETYVGMVVRDNANGESITQALPTKLIKNKTYLFSIALAKSTNYRSISRSTGKDVNFNIPAILKIWGGNTIGQHDELLGESVAVENTDWKIYTFTITPKFNSYAYFTLESYFDSLRTEAYNGNLLIDACSDLILLEK
jgi:hypothetical protein